MKKKKQSNDRRKFLKKSVEAMIVTPALATSLFLAEPRVEPTEEADELLPGDPGSRDTEAYGSVTD
jgi:hypothetical protein